MFSFLIIAVYLGIVGTVLYLIYTWVNKLILLKQEHNDLLREIVKRMESK